MQENNFEKQVQQKMDELQFVPSEPVWQKVEAQIRRKKERRRAIFLLLPLLLLGGGIFFYFSGEDKNRMVHDATTVQQVPTISKPKAIDAQQKNVEDIITDTETNIPEQDKNINTTPLNRPTTLKANNPITPLPQKENKTFKKQQVHPSVAEEMKTNKPLIGKRASNVLMEDMHSLVLENEIAKKNSDLNNENTIKDKKVSKAFQDSVNNNPVATPPLANANPVNSTAVITDTIANLNPAVTSTDKKDSTQNPAAPVLPAIASKQKKNRNWEWTITGRYGVSGTRTQMLDLFAVESVSDLYASPASGNTTQSPAFSTSNTITNSTAYSLGAGVRKKMFQNAFVSIGLQYSQYSNRSYVGSRKDNDTTVNYNGRSNLVDNYFTQTGSQSRYTTRFHYIELPLAFEYRLFRKVPLQLQHGFSVGYLFKTNALYYDRSARIFYENDEWLRKVGFNVFTSLDYRLLKAKNFSLYTGPQLQWGLTPIQQKREDKKHHQFFAGLQTRIAF